VVVAAVAAAAAPPPPPPPPPPPQPPPPPPSPPPTTKCCYTAEIIEICECGRVLGPKNFIFMYLFLVYLNSRLYIP